MGSVVSTSARVQLAAKARSDLIEKQIEEDRVRQRQDVKILLLGSRSSDRNNILKQMKIIHHNGFSLTELMEYRPAIYRNLVESAQAIIVHMMNMGLECSEHGNRELAVKILDYKLDAALGLPRTNLSFSQDIADAIHQLGKDPVIPKIMDDEHMINHDLMDSAPYFFTEALRIGKPDYIPTETDVLKAVDNGPGIKEARFTMGKLSLHVYDIGSQQLERQKWIHHFDNVKSTIFCTALSDYDEGLSDDLSDTRMTESLVLFQSVVNSRWFSRASVILLLTKIDVFKQKLQKVPLHRFFPEYTSGADINKAAKYMLWKFMQANHARLSVYPHLVQSTDTTNIRMVFAAIKETVLQNELKDSKII